MSIELDNYLEWFFTVKDPKTTMPYGIILIYQVCEGDGKKFEIAEGLLRTAFKAGMKAQRELQ